MTMSVWLGPLCVFARQVRRWNIVGMRASHGGNGGGCSIEPAKTEDVFEGIVRREQWPAVLYS